MLNWAYADYCFLSLYSTMPKINGSKQLSHFKMFTVHPDITSNYYEISWYFLCFLRDYDIIYTKRYSRNNKNNAKSIRIHIIVRISLNTQPNSTILVYVLQSYDPSSSKHGCYVDYKTK